MPLFLAFIFSLSLLTENVLAAADVGLTGSHHVAVELIRLYQLLSPRLINVVCYHNKKLC